MKNKKFIKILNVLIVFLIILFIQISCAQVSNESVESYKHTDKNKDEYTIETLITLFETKVTFKIIELII